MDPVAVSAGTDGNGLKKTASERAKELVRKNEEETIAFFGPPSAAVVDLPVADDNDSLMLRMSSLYNDLYRGAQERENGAKNKNGGTISANRPEKRMRTVLSSSDASDAKLSTAADAMPVRNAIPDGVLERVQERVVSHQNGVKDGTSTAVIVADGVVNDEERLRLRSATSLALRSSGGASALSTSLALAGDRPEWHAPWRLFRTISGHLGWVRSVAVDPTNEWFATGSADRTIKIWDIATGGLRLTLTGHIAAVRGLAVSTRHPYMFSVGEDKTVKCWDLEHNKVIRSYHGHLSGVYCVALHPELDVVITGGRDSAVRVWDMRSRAQVFALTGHRDSINDVVAQANDPQIISASVDSTVRLWDLAAGKCASTLTNHKRGVRGLALHPREYSFASVSVDNIKTWGLPEGTFMRNFGGQHKKLVNCLAVNEDGVLVSGGDDGRMCMWDWKSAHCFQNEQTIVQPGSLECEAAIYAMSFDKSGSRLITCEADKTIKMWKEDVTATPDTHPLDWKPNLRPQHY